MTLFAAIASPINEIADSLGANNLPYALPLHPNLVHLTIGLFAIGIAFDFAGAFYPLEKRLFRFLALPVQLSCGLVQPGGLRRHRLLHGGCGFYNAVGGAVERSQHPRPDRHRHHALACHRWRRHPAGDRRHDHLARLPTFRRARTWGASDLAVPAQGASMLMLMGLHGSLGAWLASDFGVHITADQLLAAGADLQEVLP